MLQPGGSAEAINKNLPKHQTSLESGLMFFSSLFVKNFFTIF